MRIGSILPAMVLGLAVASSADAASITFQNETFGTGAGIGAVPTILVVQKTPDESGAVAWNGTADVESGDAKSQSQTWSVTDLGTLGIFSTDTEFGLVLNLNETEPGSPITLTGLQANFFSAAGSLLFSAPYACAACPYPLPMVLDEAAQGTGSSGFLFRVSLDAAERTLFFGSGANRLGLALAANFTDSGQETIYLADLEPRTVEPLNPVPEPASLVLLATGLGALAYRGARGRRGETNPRR